MSESQTLEPKTITPRLSIPIPDSQVRKTFMLKSQLIAVLTEYTRFLSEHHNRRIDENLVIETLIAKLNKDRHFRAWKAKKKYEA